MDYISRTQVSTEACSSRIICFEK